MRRILSIIICVATVLVCFAFSASAQQEDTLRFNSDGKFKIMMINDPQETDFSNPRTLELIRKALDSEKPDLVVLVGDNIADAFAGANEKRVRKAIDNVVNPIAKRGIKFALVFGNHDSESGITREMQMSMYQQYAGCLAVDEGDALPGCGTYNLPIMSSDSDRVVFNVWMMDSGTKGESGYPGVTPEQIAWYEQTSAALRQANGGDAVPSLLFQHIPVYEIYDALEESSENVIGAVPGFGGHSGKWYVLPQTAQGVLLDGPGTSKPNGEYAAWLRCGDIVGAFFGHDHVNNFVSETPDGIKIGYNAGAGFRNAGNGDQRSVRIFVINQNNPNDYETYVRTYRDLTGKIIPFYISDIVHSRWEFVIKQYWHAFLNIFHFNFRCEQH